jgi:M6 family metalloprotease-like protein
MAGGSIMKHRLVLLILFGSLVAVHANAVVPLYTWFSPSRGDYFTTSNPLWAGAPGDRKPPDYIFMRREGSVFSPDAPQPEDTVPLYSWWSRERGDNFLTTDPRWRGTPGATQSGYVFARLEGYVHTRPVMGTVPLRAYWNRRDADNYTTTDRHFDETRPPVNFVGGATYGYIYGSEHDERAQAFGFGAMKVNGRAATGTRPLLLMLVEFRDMRFAPEMPAAMQVRSIFGPGDPNVAAYFREVSEGRFGWLPAGVVGPVMAEDVPGTARDESTLADALYDETLADGTVRAEGRALAARVVASALRSNAIDFRSYDTNHDEVLTTDEMIVVMIYASGRSWTAAERALLPWRVDVPGAVSVASDVAIVADGATFATRAHEIAHTLGAIDVYGSGAHSNNITLMSGTWGGPDDRRTWYLDPWHRMQLGWTMPRILELSEAGSIARIAAPQSRHTNAYDRRPILLHDPRHPRQFFLIEYRSALGLGYDQNVWDWRNSAFGTAVWQVMVDEWAMARIIDGVGIAAGPGGVLESQIGGDDFAQDNDRNGVNDEIRPGGDRVLQSIRGGNDEMELDRAMFILGAPDATRGTGNLLQASDGPMRVPWLSDDGRPDPANAATMIAVAPTTSVDETATVTWAARPVARIDLAPAAVRAGSTISIAGVFPANRPATAIVRLYNTSLRWVAPIVTWSPSEVVARVSEFTRPGTYKVEVSLADGASNFRTVQVLPR